LPLHDALEALATEAGCTPAQLALAWVLSRGDHVCAIPGTTRRAHLEENAAAAALQVNDALLARLGAVFAPNALRGPRYNGATQAEIDTEELA
jgi:aryl-alcohol dehydrogenase-like predicted oxidoreductase